MDKSKTLWHDCRSCRYKNFVLRGFGFVHHSIAILYRAVPNPNLTIRNFFIAVYQQQRRWRAAERRHPTGRERMGSPTLQTFQDPLLLLPWVCFRGGGFPSKPRRPKPRIEDPLPHSGGFEFFFYLTCTWCLSTPRRSSSLHAAGVGGGQPPSSWPQAHGGLHAPRDVLRRQDDDGDSAAESVAGGGVRVGQHRRAQETHGRRIHLHRGSAGGGQRRPPRRIHHHTGEGVLQHHGRVYWLHSQRASQHRPAG
jgi:hypothetical protein